MAAEAEQKYPSGTQARRFGDRERQRGERVIAMADGGAGAQAGSRGRVWRGALRCIAAALPVILALCLAGAASAASSSRAAVGSPAPLAPGTQTVGRTASSTRLRLAVVLRAQAGLAAYATAVSTPGSPLYGHFLTVAQFAGRFGATPTQVAAVSSTLRAAGLHIGSVSANQLVIPVTGTAGQVENAFSIALARVKLSGGRLAYTNEQAPTLPVSVASHVLGVVGLSDIARYTPVQLRRPNPKQHLGVARSRRAHPSVATGRPQPCASAVARQSENGLTADEVAAAYGFSGLYGIGAGGGGQTIALFEQQAYNPADVAAYQACYRTHVPVANVDVDGGPPPYRPPPQGQGDAESSMDIEQAIGLAPSSSILVYQGPFTYPQTATVDIINAIVSQNRAKVISSSYGLCETLTGLTIVRAENTLLQEAAIQGQSFFTASGISGSAQCYPYNQSDTGLAVLDPAGQPFAIGVGGTTVLTRGPSCPTPSCYWTPGTPLVQSVWNDGFDPTSNRVSATGGGVSQFWTMPTYQSQSPPFLGVTNPNSQGGCIGVGFCREVPDVSADADPNTGYVVFTDGSWTITGGTGGSAPLWASFMADTNSQAGCAGLSIGFANPALYALAGTHYSTYFSDITLASPFSDMANNDAIGANGGLFPVRVGYDMTTGLGSMVGSRLASSLCALRVPPATATTEPATGISATSATIHGIVNPNGVTTLFGFDVGRTRSYGASSTPASVGSRARNVAFSASVTRLSPNTTYHYRVVAIRNGRVVAVGSDRTFKTRKRRHRQK